MNKNLFRIIFNQHRGQRMAVAETSSSQGKAASGTTQAAFGSASLCADAPMSKRMVVSFGAVSLAVLSAIGAVALLLPSPASAQVVAYNAQDAANTVNQLTNGQGQVQQSTNNYDFIGRILGGNAGTGGTIPPGSSVLEEVIKTMGGSSTVHNNYGQGQDQKGIDDYWGGVKPVLQPVTPTNVLSTLPTGEGK